MKTMKKLLAPLSFLVLLGCCLPVQGAAKRKKAKMNKLFAQQLKMVAVQPTIEELDDYVKATHAKIKKDREKNRKLTKKITKLPDSLFTNQEKTFDAAAVKRWDVLEKRAQSLYDLSDTPPLGLEVAVNPLARLVVREEEIRLGKKIPPTKLIETAEPILRRLVETKEKELLPRKQSAYIRRLRKDIAQGGEIYQGIIEQKIQELGKLRDAMGAEIERRQTKLEEAEYNLKQALDQIKKKPETAEMGIQPMLVDLEVIDEIYEAPLSDEELAEETKRLFKNTLSIIKKTDKKERVVVLKSARDLFEDLPAYQDKKTKALKNLTTELDKEMKLDSKAEAILGAMQAGIKKSPMIEAFKVNEPEKKPELKLKDEVERIKKSLSAAGLKTITDEEKDELETLFMLQVSEQVNKKASTKTEKEKLIETLKPKMPHLTPEEDEFIELLEGSKKYSVGKFQINAAAESITKYLGTDPYPFNRTEAQKKEITGKIQNMLNNFKQADAKLVINKVLVEYPGYAEKYKEELEEAKK